ncbi:hypothetical protein E4M16_08170 [Ligilactobacillus ruminis]|nr:hypothetical protein E4M16_08170 [Ligilactobacillus ruminis]
MRDDACCDENSQKRVLSVTEGWHLRASLKNRHFARKDVLAHGLSSTAFGKIVRIDENRDFVRKLFCKYFHSLPTIRLAFP